MTLEEKADKLAEDYVMREDTITENDRVPFDNGYGDTHYLVSVDGSIFLHPMDFRAVLHNCGCNTDDSFNCEALKKVCDKIAKHCGGTFDLEVSKPFEIEADLVPYEKGIHNTL